MVTPLADRPSTQILGCLLKPACDIPGCPKRFATEALRTKHRTRHIPARPYECPKPGCPAAVKWPNKSMQRHFREVHDGQLRYRCFGCREWFGTKARLDDHTEGCALYDVRVVRHVCTTCHATFESMRILKLHERLHTQTRVEFLSCPDWGKTYVDRNGLQQHRHTVHGLTVVVHTAPIIGTCPTCGREFHRKKRLDAHVRTCREQSMPITSLDVVPVTPLAEDRPLACPHCGKRYKAWACYNDHVLVCSTAPVVSTAPPPPPKRGRQRSSDEDDADWMPGRE